MAIDQFYPQTSVRTTAGTWHTCWHSAEIEHRFWNPHDPDMPRHAWGMFLSDWLRSNVGFDKVYLCRSLKALIRPPGRQTATLTQIGAQLSAGKPDNHSLWLGRQQSHLQCKCCSRILRCDDCRKQRESADTIPQFDVHRTHPSMKWNIKKCLKIILRLAG